MQVAAFVWEMNHVLMRFRDSKINQRRPPVDVTAFLRRPRKTGVKLKARSQERTIKIADFKSFSIVYLNYLYEILVFHVWLCGF